MAKEKKNFSWRGWTTFVVTISFIVDTLSGIILYIAPPGRIANWTNWRIWGLDKEDWGAIHTIFGYVLLIIVALHLYYNWKIFLNFIWNKIKKAINLRWEMLFAIVVSLFIFLGTLWNIPPFSSTMELGDYFKTIWEESKVETPITHGEILSLEEFAKKVQVPADEIVTTLKSKGYKVISLEQTLGEIAEQNNTSPDKLYEAMKSEGVKPIEPKTLEGSGLGKKTLEKICSEQGISLDDTLSRLRQKGIDAKPGDRLKDLAGKLGMSPMDVLALIQGKSP